jgi:hypothetical protein
MNNPNEKNRRLEKPVSFVTAILHEPAMIRSLVESLALRNIISIHPVIEMEEGRRMMHSSFVEAYASGWLYFSDEKGLKHFPFESCFLFSCIKKHRGKYEMTWATSLS